MLVVKVDLRLKRSMSASGTKRKCRNAPDISGAGGRPAMPPATAALDPKQTERACASRRENWLLRLTGLLSYWVAIKRSQPDGRVIGKDNKCGWVP